MVRAADQGPDPGGFQARLFPELARHAVQDARVLWVARSAGDFPSPGPGVVGGALD